MLKALTHDIVSDTSGKVSSAFVKSQLAQEYIDQRSSRTSKRNVKSFLLGQELAYQKVFRYAKSSIVVPEAMVRYRACSCDGYYIGRGGHYGCGNMLCPACYARFLKCAYNKVTHTRGSTDLVAVLGLELPVVETKVEQDLQFERGTLAKFYSDMSQLSKCILRVSHVVYRDILMCNGDTRSVLHTAHTFIMVATPYGSPRIANLVNKNLRKGMTELRLYESVKNGKYLSDTFRYPTAILSPENASVLQECIHPLHQIKPKGWAKLKG